MPADEYTCVEETRTFSQAEFDDFARLSGDANPIHVDPAFASGTAFGATVAHGMLLFSAIRGLITRHLPGRRLLDQELKFPAPTYADERVTLTLQVLEGENGGVLRVATAVIKADGRSGLEGECRVSRSDTA